MIINPRTRAMEFIELFEHNPHSARMLIDRNYFRLNGTFDPSIQALWIDDICLTILWFTGILPFRVKIDLRQCDLCFQSFD